MHKNAFKSSAVRPTTTWGGATIVLTSSAMPTKPQSIPIRLSKDASVILIAFAERTRNITEILQNIKFIWNY